ncbi:hypothetical protein LCGC14_0336280 [marine sediment metagenome]|uniref:LexA repressor DNA-binding domain-containing protein n=1 Tax=marine sediment metagenome TaxID=412755 RepID=A0A0F9WMG1_9ZZZZ
MTSANLTDRQSEIVAYVRQFAEVHGKQPTVREIAAWVGVAPPNAWKHVKRLEALGMLSRTPGVARSIRVTDVTL